jgi:addiction module RelE/StbE family toxin
MRIAWEEEAERDLDRIVDYILQDDPAVALHLVDVIREAVQILTDHPHIGRVGRVVNTRELVIPGTRYIIPYQALSDTVVILRVLHGAQRWPESFREP